MVLLTFFRVSAFVNLSDELQFLTFKFARLVATVLLTVVKLMPGNHTSLTLAVDTGEDVGYRKHNETNPHSHHFK